MQVLLTYYEFKEVILRGKNSTHNHVFLPQKTEYFQLNDNKNDNHNNNINNNYCYNKTIQNGWVVASS